jgi:hypothetical protein
LRTFLHWAVAYIAVGLSAGLAAWSGARGADATLADAGIKAAIMFVIAMLGCHGWAWAARLAKDGHWGWAVTSWVALTLALGVTLLGSAGSFYRAATERISTAERGSDAYKRADAELRRIEARRKKLTEHRSVGEIEPDLTTAQADRRYKATDGCAPAQITKSAAFCANYRRLEQEKAAAEEAARLDEQSAPHLAIVGKGQPTAYGGPGDIIAATFGTTQQMGNALFSLMCTLALDFGAVMALVTAELRNPHERKRAPAPRTVDRPSQCRRQAPEAPLPPPRRRCRARAPALAVAPAAEARCQHPAAGRCRARLPARGRGDRGQLDADRDVRCLHRLHGLVQGEVAAGPGPRQVFRRDGRPLRRARHPDPRGGGVRLSR